MPYKFGRKSSNRNLHMKTAAKFGIIFGSFAALAVAGALKADARLPFKSQKEIVGKAPEARWLAKSPKPEFGGIRYRLKDSWIGFGLGLYARTGGGGATGITPAMAMLTAYSRTLTDEVASYEATYTGASHKTMTDQYGLQTFGPNNLATYSEDFSNGNWAILASYSSKVSTSATDRDGGSTALELSFLQQNGYLSKNSIGSNLINGETYIVSFWARRDTGSNQLKIGTNTGTLLGNFTPNGTWTRYYAKFTYSSSWVHIYIQDTNASGFTNLFICDFQVERVTHETAPRAYNATTSAAYYGYRCVYAPETLEASTTSITIGSGSSYTFTTAAAHSFAVGNVVQATDNADPDNWIRGYVTGTTSTTVTLASYTFPGTAYSRPVLTNGSGTISDWSVIRSDGYLAEPAATNLHPYSSGLNWDTGGGYAFVASSIVSSAYESIFGTNTALRLAETAATGQHFYYNSCSITSGTTYCGWAILEKGPGASAPDSVQLAFRTGGHSTNPYGNFNISTGVVGTKTATDSGMIDLGNGRWLCYIVATANGTSTAGGSFFLFNNNNNSSAYGNTLSYAGNTAADVIIHHMQCEVGSVPTSAIVTAASSVARSADVASMTSTNFSGWWNATEGTIIAKADISKTAANERIFAASNSGGTDRFQAYAVYPSLTMAVIDGGVSQFSGTDASATEISVLALAYKADDFNGAVNGTAFTPDTSGTLPTVDTLDIGMFNYGSFLSGAVPEILYFSTRESDAQLVTLTGG